MTRSSRLRMVMGTRRLIKKGRLTRYSHCWGKDQPEPHISSYLTSCTKTFGAVKARHASGMLREFC